MESFIKNMTEVIDDNIFFEIADIILNKTVLLVNNNKFRISEIEFYLKNENHNDQYTHCDVDQLKYGSWYFHKYKNGTYKSGTYKGVDLTLGNQKSYCGILIRSIYDIDNNLLIEGPCNCVNAILKIYNMSSVIEFINLMQCLSVVDNNAGFILKNYSYTNDNNIETKENIYSGPRIGLSEKYIDFKSKPYRFLIFYDKIKKGKKNMTLCIHDNLG